MAEKQLLIVLFPRDCVHCGSPAGNTECDYKCPSCRKNFCSKCYGTHKEGDGTYVFCPHCKAQLYFPAVPKSVPEFTRGDVCIFTNRGSSGLKVNDSKKCTILRVKEFWIDPRIPEYHILFLHSDNSFGASERELRPAI